MCGRGAVDRREAASVRKLGRIPWSGVWYCDEASGASRRSLIRALDDGCSGVDGREEGASGDE